MVYLGEEAGVVGDGPDENDAGRIITRSTPVVPAFTENTLDKDAAG
jgi:hypothetical protein